MGYQFELDMEQAKLHWLRLPQPKRPLPRECFPLLHAWKSALALEQERPKQVP
jgi:hypothetical protein